mmetsp:Transcript_18922/g.45335  ORF Transcript_18922/g.45335 Transcript_18922/m.45335 type:complete len:168 (-) Transcript_18922:105-608(-)
MSSKIPVSRHREVVQGPKRERRDPRFERFAGKLNEDLFRKSYAFVSQERQQEVAELRNQMKGKKSKELKRALQARVDKLEQQAHLVAKAQKERERAAARRKNEREQVAQGKKPYFLKKKDERLLAAVQKYEELKKTGRVDDYIAKRSKHKASKDRRHLPYGRRSQAS